MRFSRRFSTFLFMLLLCGRWATAADVWIDTSEENATAFSYGGTLTSIEIADIDSDSNTDVIYGTRSIHSLRAILPARLAECVILWNGQSSEVVSNRWSGSVVASARDLNDDGLIDIQDAGITLFNTGHRYFITELSRHDYGSQSVDLDGDATIDFISGTTWRIGTEESNHEFSKESSNFQIIDVNNDSRPDVVCESTSKPYFFWYENTGGETLFSEHQVIGHL